MLNFKTILTATTGSQDHIPERSTCKVTRQIQIPKVSLFQKHRDWETIDKINMYW